MTERLAALLREEADSLDIPAPASAEVLAHGRRIRRRRRVTGVVAAAAVLGVVGAGSVTAYELSRGEEHVTRLDPARAAYLQGGAFAEGSTVHFGATDDYDVRIEEKVKALYYTSAGVVVRAGNTPWTDDPGPSHYSLVAPDGSITPLDLDLGDRKPGTDPTTPYLAYGDPDGEGWAVVVRDVRTDDEVARVPVPGTFTWGGWEAPPVALSGDVVYVAMDGPTLAVNWRTGEITRPDRLPESSYPEIAGGHAASSREGRVSIFDIASGSDLVTIPVSGYGWAQLSPDGRYARVGVEEAPGAGESFDVYDVATGRHASIDGAGGEFGWTPDGHLIQVTQAGVKTCDPISGDCEVTPIELGDGELKIGGNDYES